MSGDRFDFELDHEVGFGPVTAHGGVPVLPEYFRSSGAASIVVCEISFKRRKRGLSSSEMVDSLLALWACAGQPHYVLDGSEFLNITAEPSKERLHPQHSWPLDSEAKHASLEHGAADA